jgi:hypothetical protein
MAQGKGKKKRPKRFTDEISAEIFNRGMATKHIKREIKKAENLIKRGLTRNKKGLLRTPGHKKIREGEQVIRVIEIIRKQGFTTESERYKRLQSHIQRLKDQLKTLA